MTSFSLTCSSPAIFSSAFSRLCSSWLVLRRKLKVRLSTCLWQLHSTCHQHPEGLLCHRQHQHPVWLEGENFSNSQLRAWNLHLLIFALVHVKICTLWSTWIQFELLATDMMARQRCLPLTCWRLALNQKYVWHLDCRPRSPPLALYHWNVYN